MLLFCFVLQALCGQSKSATCYIENGQVTIKEGNYSDGVGWALFEDTIDTVGWFKFHVETSSKYPSNHQMICAGALDGYLGQHRIFERFNLYKDIMGLPRDQQFNPKWEDWMIENLEYTRNQVSVNPNDKYWASIGLILKQFDGLYTGYSFAAPTEEKLRMIDLLFIQSIGDVYDLVTVWSNKTIYNEFFHLECSGLVAISPDYQELYFGQDAWSSFLKMHNVLKEYHINVSEHSAKRIVISTRMGALASSDDFWLSDQGLMVLETTNNNFNKSLYDFVTTKSLLTWIRVLHATWVSQGAEEWTKEFIRENSGTYNNQYIVVDSKKFYPGKKPTKDLIWVIEQLPSLYRSADLTNLLSTRRWFPSINTPFFEDIFNIAGYPEKIKEKGDLGDYYSYYNSSRFLIFQREAPKIKNFEDFKKLMRFNNWKNDEYGHKDAGQQILARYDLRLPDCKYGKANAFGGLDTKAAKATEILSTLSFEAIASPEHENNPPWAFGEGQFAHLHYDGLPRVWNFSWINFSANSYNRCNSIKTTESCINTIGCGWCIYADKCMSGYSHGPINEKCEEGWVVKTELEPWAKPVVIITSTIIVLFVLSIYAIHFISKKKESQNPQYDKI